MATKVILKKSAVAAKVPLSTDLDYGELALNYADGKLYYKNSVNTVGVLNTGTGTVTSVSGTGTVSGLSLSGTVTTSGNLSLGGTLAVDPSNFSPQTAKTFLAAPDAAAGTPTFRTILASDIPTLNQNTTGSAASLTTARTISLTGDVTYTSASFNGSANVTGTATLANSGVTAGTYGKVTVDAKGRVTSGTALVASDIPSLDASKITSGVIDAARLPSFVDDVLEFANLAGFPTTGETGKIYVAIDTNKTYRWSGSAYVYITSGAVDSVAGKTGVVTLVKGDVGLGNVDNTSDASKPVSTAQQTALNLKANLASPTFTGTPAAPTAAAGTSTTQIATTAFVNAEIANDAAPIGHVGSGGTAHANVVAAGAAGFMTGADKTKLDGVAAGAQVNTVTSVAAKTGAVTLVKGDVGLGNVDNTSDASKPVSTAQLAALNLKANLASPALTDTPTAPTAAVGTNTTQLATTAFVNAEIANDAPTKTGGGASGTWPIAVTGNAATTDWVRPNGSLAYGNSGFQYFNAYGISGNSPGANGAPGADWYHFFRGNHANTAGYYADIALGLNDSSMWYRRITGGTAYGWYRVLDSSNYNTYSPTLTGGNASGTWPISIGGAAGKVTNTSVSAAVQQVGDIGNAFAEWTGSAIPAVQVDAQGNTSAYMIWRATHWGVRHIAAMHVYEGDMTVSMSVGSNRNFIWDSNGNFTATGNVTAYSDIRLKTDLIKIPDALNKVTSLNGYTYTRTDTGVRQTGVIAQELIEVLPEAVSTAGEHMSVAYGNMAGLLIEAIKELNEKVTVLTARVAELEAR